MAHFVVTGGCGFIGSHLVDALLDRGERVTVLDNLSTGRRTSLGAAADLRIGDVLDADLLTDVMVGAKGVFHLAAVASVQRCNEAWRDSHSVNQTGTVSVLEAARAAGGIPVVYASSAAVYGGNQNLPLRESDTATPLTAYGVDKWASEAQAKVGGNIHGVPSLGLRLFNVYGPRQAPSSPYSGVISILLDRMLAGAEVVIHGDGDQTRDFVYVDDVVGHFMAGMAVADVSAPVVNVCTGRGASIRELTGIVRRLTRYTGTIEHGPARPGDVRASVGDPALAIRTLNCRAGIDLVDGLSRLLRSVPREEPEAG